MLLVLALFTMLCGCGDEYDMSWESMKWKSEVFGYLTKDGKKYIHVPKYGDRCIFTCTNYNRFWVSSVAITEDGSTVIHYENPDDRRIFKDKTIYVEIESNKMKVYFPPSCAKDRMFEVVVTAGDIFHTFRFMQSE